MANIFSKLLSKATFWDKSDDQRIAKDDEEERKRKAALAARQSVSATNQPAPTLSIQDKPVSTPSLSVASQSQFGNKEPLKLFQPDQKLQKVIPPKPSGPLQDEEFKGIDNGDKHEKKLFGLGMGKVLGKNYGYTTDVKTGRNFKTNKDKYVADFDTLDDERKKILVNDAKKRAEQGDTAAQNTIRALTESGRMKGNVNDFIEGANDKLYGGMNRAAARTVELLPGNQGTGEWADRDAAHNQQYTSTGRAGEKFGSVEKGIVDVGTMAIPGAKLDKMIDASNAYKALTTGSKIANIGARGGKVVAGSLMGTGIDAMQQVGRGDKPDLLQSAGTGLAVDTAVSLLPYGAGKLAKYVEGNKADSTGVQHAITDIVGDASKLKKIATTQTDVGVAEREAAGLAEEAASVPSRGDEPRKSSSEPTVQVAPGVMSTNMAKAEPTHVRTEQGAVIDRGTDLKVGELMDKTAGVPVRPGMKRLYQGTENGQPTDWYFDNVDDLAKYFSNRSDNVALSYRDVPEGSAVPQAERGPGVYRFAEDNAPSVPAGSMDGEAPAYARGTPTTVGQAAGQHRLTGETNLPDSAFDADARMAGSDIPTASDPLDVPTYMRRQADERAATATQDLAGIDQRIAAWDGESGQLAKFNRRADATARLAENPTKGRVVNAQISDSLNAPGRTREGLVKDRAQVAADLRAAEEAQAANRALAETPNIPDPSDPIALAKATDDIPAAPVDDTNVADFSRAINGSEPLAKVDAPLTAEGNAGLQSDAVAMRQAVEAGEAPQLNTSGAAIASADGSAAPRTRGRAASMIRDEDLRNEVMQNFPEKQVMNIAETERRAVQDINNMTDGELIGSLPNNIIVDTPEDFLRTVNSIRRLESIGTPESQDAIANAVNALTDFSARSGRNLRTTQILFDDMPVALKVKTLEKQLNKAGADLDDNQMAMLTHLVTRADDATDQLRTLEDEARTLLESGSINNGSLSPEVQARANELGHAIDQARAAKELSSGEAWRYWQEQMPNGPIGKRIGDVGRTLMLSSPTGRVFDIASTTATAADDTLTRGVSNLMGKALNKITGAGTVQDTLPNANAMLQGLSEGAQRTGQAFKGNDYVEDVLGEAKRATRGDVNTGGGKIRQIVRAAVELPTNLTRGLRTDQLYREGMQEAAGIGLQGEARQTYAKLRAAVPSQQQLEEAVQVHMRANMLHDNGISRALNNVANSLDQKGGGWAAPFIRNQIMPFTSWLGGNLHRTLTDKNVLWNVGSAINNAVKHNPQGVIDDVAKLAVNSGEAYAAGMLLTQAGIITTQDANGDDYGGLYFHIGDRYIPVAAAGTVAVPLILGNGIQQAYEAGQNGASGEEVVSKFVNSAGLNTLKNAGVSSVFGGDNNLQSSVDTALREGGDLVSGGTEFAGNIVRQYIPGLMSDVNAGLDQTNLNPTHEAAETKVTHENPETGRQVTDVLSTEVNKTLNKVPFASQNLDRKPDTASKDLIDRMTKGNRETGAQADSNVKTKSLKEMKAQLVRDKVPLMSEDIKSAMDDGNFEKARRGLDYQIAEEQAKPDASESKIKKLQDQRTQADMGERGVPITDDGIKARTEEGDYDKAMEGLSYQLEKAQGNKDVPKSNLKKMEDQIMRLRVAKDREYTPDTISAYDKTSNSEWKAMGDPESEDYDPDMYSLLAQYDADLAANGVSASTKDGSKQKYYNSGSGSGGGKGGKAGLSENPATNKISFDGFAPIKMQAADGQPVQSAIPTLEKVRNNDTTKLKKISVTRGGR
jgi:hypothetical protein